MSEMNEKMFCSCSRSNSGNRSPAASALRYSSLYLGVWDLGQGPRSTLVLAKRSCGQVPQRKLRHTLGSVKCKLAAVRPWLQAHELVSSMRCTSAFRPILAALFQAVETVPEDVCWCDEPADRQQ